MRRIVLSVLFLATAASLAACSSSRGNSAAAPAATGPGATSIAGAPRGPTSAWTTPPSASYQPMQAPVAGQPAAPVYAAPDYVAPSTAPAPPAPPAGPASSCGGGKG